VTTPCIFKPETPDHTRVSSKQPDKRGRGVTSEVAEAISNIDFSGRSLVSIRAHAAVQVSLFLLMLVPGQRVIVCLQRLCSS